MITKIKPFCLFFRGSYGGDFLDFRQQILIPFIISNFSNQQTNSKKLKIFFKLFKFRKKFFSNFQHFNVEIFAIYSISTKTFVNAIL